MKKLSEMNAVELSAAICKMAEPASRLVEDERVFDVMRGMAEKLKEAKIPIKGIAVFLTTLVPVLLGDTHRNDTLEILAAVSGEDPEALKRKNGILVAKQLYSLMMEDTDALRAFRPDQEARAE